MSEPALRASGLGKRFGRSVALEGVDLELPAGASLAVLGPNGAGKSTLLRLIAGLARPTAGALQVFGTPAHQPAARARVGFIGHASLLYPSLTARENLLFAARLQRVAGAAARVEQWLERSGLTRVAGLPVSHFSRGMSQRLAIARGLVHDPSLVLLDEPFAGLDVESRGRVLELLDAEQREAGFAVLIASHDPLPAPGWAHRELALRQGVLQRA